MSASIAGEYFEIVEETSARAEIASGETFDRFYEAAGLLIRLQFFGASLLPMIRALAHLEVRSPGSEPDLNVHLWDSTSSGVAMPPCPCPIEDFTLRGELRGFHDNRYYTAYDGLSRILSLFDVERKAAAICVFDARGIPTYERGAPLRTLFGWWLRQHGRQLVHAAAVGTAEGGVLIVGKGGAGKSNTAVGCLIAGLAYAADDFCAVAADPVPTVHSLYSSAKLRVGDWARLPFPPNNPEDPVTEKRLYYLLPHFSGRLPACLPIRAILWPTRTGSGDPTLQRIPATAPLLETASQTTSMLAHAGGEVLSTLSKVARRVPCYRLELGSRPTRIPGVISELIQSLAAKGRLASEAS